MQLDEYITYARHGNTNEIIALFREELDICINRKELDRKIKYSPNHQHSQTFSGGLFTPRFFAGLYLFPSVPLEVNSSRTELKKTCYGFRDHLSGERVYLRYDTDSILEFRDSPAGFLIGRRYYIPGLSRIRNFRWDKVIRLVSRQLRLKGFTIRKVHIREYAKMSRVRYALAYKLRQRRKKYLDKLERKKWRLSNQHQSIQPDTVQQPQCTRSILRIIPRNRNTSTNSLEIKVFSSSTPTPAPVPM